MTRQMKDSGVEWIGEIPEDWEVIRFKRLSNFFNGYAFKGHELSLDGKKYVIRIGNFQNNKLIINSDTLKTNIENYKLLNYKVKKNDVLIAMSGATVGKTVYISNIDNDIYINQRVGIIRSDLNKLLKYFFLIDGFSEYTYLNSQGSAQPNISETEILNFQIPLPKNYTQQKSIAVFLDKKIREIDNIIAKSKQAIEEYKRYKQALITKVITKGLDKTTCLKDSGIDWIGAIPENWETAKLKYLVKQPLKYGANSSGCEFKEELPRYIRITDISKDNKLIDTGKLSIDLSENSEFILQDGDILFARSGATVGKTFYYKKEMGVSGFAGYLIRARINDNNLSKYIYYITLSSYYEKWKDSILIQATIENIGADKYNNLIATVPPINEQKEIVIYLDKKTSQIDDIIAKKEKLVEEMEAYKKSLIFETVTGKREVD